MEGCRDARYTIIEYDPHRHAEAQSLLDELEEYLAAVDEDGLDRITEDYRATMLDHDLAEVRRCGGKCYLALCGDTVCGLIIGIFRQYSETDHLDYSCPPAGVITELAVREACRHRGIGKALIRQLEAYFAENGCAYVFTDIFAYNKDAQAFYGREGYHPRMITSIKKLDRDH